MKIINLTARLVLTRAEAQIAIDALSNAADVAPHHIEALNVEGGVVEADELRELIRVMIRALARQRNVHETISIDVRREVLEVFSLAVSFLSDMEAESPDEDRAYTDEHADALIALKAGFDS